MVIYTNYCTRGCQKVRGVQLSPCHLAIYKVIFIFYKNFCHSRKNIYATVPAGENDKKLVRFLGHDDDTYSIRHWTDQ